MIKDIIIKSTSGTSIHCVFSKPNIEIKGLVQIVHGMAEYAARYKSFMEFLSENGYLVFGHDHLGHGLTAPTTDDLGYIPIDGGADMLIDDTIAVAKHFSAQYPGKPLYLMGHSMGSFIARCVFAKAGEMYTAAALSGTGYAVFGAGLGRKIAIYRAKAKGERYYSDFVYRLAFGQYNKKMPNRTPYDWICRDEGVVDEYLADEYCGFPFTVSALAVLMELNIKCKSEKIFAATPKNMPILLMSGVNDPVGDYGRGVQKVYEDYRKNGLKHAEIKLYPEARHEVLNELNKAEVMQDILHWYETERGLNLN